MVATKRPGILGPRVRPAGTWFQRSIVALLVEDADGDRHVVSVGIAPANRPRGKVLAYRLICGHDRVTQRSVTSDTARTAAPCPECGAAQRAPAERAHHRAELYRQVKRCGYPCPERESLVDALELALLVAAQLPSSARDEELGERMVIALRAAGIDRGMDASCN